MNCIIILQCHTASRNMDAEMLPKRGKGNVDRDALYFHLRLLLRFIFTRMDP